MAEIYAKICRDLRFDPICLILRKTPPPETPPTSDAIGDRSYQAPASPVRPESPTDPPG